MWRIPEMTDLQSRLTALSPAKRALLERKLRDKAQREEIEPIQPRGSAAAPPLSFGQQRLWFLEQWEHGNPAYNSSMTLRLEGALDADALDRSLTEISRRHEALRTTFAADGDTPVQIIHPAGPVAARRIDLTAVPPDLQNAELARLIAEEAALPFDFLNGPLWRAMMLKLDADVHCLRLSVHHIVFDGWSMGVLHHELFALYDAFVSGHASPLPELPIQYADYAAWQRRRIHGDVGARQLKYWREHLHDLPTIDLPTDRARPPSQTFTGALHEIHLPGTVVQRLKALSRAEGATLFITMLAAFQTLLHRYTGQPDMVVGTPIAGRTRIEVEELIGFFVNVLVLRTSASGDPTFREMLRRAGKSAFDAYAHQDVPFEQLVQELRPRRDTSRNPLFDVIFAFQNTPRGASAQTRLKVTEITVAKPYTRFDLEVHVYETADGLSGHFIYNTALFDAATIERMTGHFRVLLDGIAADPDQRLSRLPLLTTAERHQMLVEWNQTATSYPRDACIHALFEARADAAPDSVAVEFNEQRLTYRELNARANRLAHQLRALGVGPGAVVGVCLERCPDLIVAVLGILKAGGAYLPLDPSHPHQRLEFMIEDARVSIVLTCAALHSRVPQTRARLLDVDEVSKTWSEQNPAAGAIASSLAYVIYTSGSTGRPKGVCVEHRSVVRLLIDTKYIDLGPSDRIAHSSNPSFDVSTFEIWGPLLHGGTMIIIPPSVLLSAKECARTLREQKIGTLFLTPALFNQIASEVPTAFGTLRHLLVGGDTCDPKWARTVLTHGAPQHLLNAYGPTEATTFATCHRVEQVDEAATSVPIGRPISNTRTYVLDRHLQPVPIGVIGELHIGGDGLAREYLNRPELTAEQFIADPFDDHPAARLYKTGDFARFLPDGTIDFVGRVDRQLKIRGFRIELQEIEAVLSQHPGVSQTAVLARQRTASDKALVAYVVPSNGERPASDTLRAFLRDKLPDFMVPSAFVMLDALPLTSNGKVDQAALPDPEPERNEEGPRFAEPRTSIEKELAQMWEGLLGVKRVGIHDNFFDLGGHSLLATQVVSRIERRFGKTLPVAVLFQSPTIQELAGLLSDERPTSHSSLIPVQPNGSKVPFFWIHGDSSIPLLANYLGSDRPVYAIDHQLVDGRPASHTGVDAIAEQYLKDIRAVRPHGPYLLGGFCFGAMVAFELAHQLRRQGHEVGLLLMLDPPGFAIESAPPPPSAPRELVRRHVDELARRGLRGKVEYLLPKMIAVAFAPVAAVTTPIAKKVNELRRKVCLMTGMALPRSLRGSYMLDVYGQAIQAYAPQGYKGRVLLLKGGNKWYPPSMDWRQLITGQLEVHEGPDKHLDMVKEPFVAVWARQLKEALDRVDG